MSCFMSDLRQVFFEQEQKALHGKAPVGHGAKRAPSELAARFGAWRREALARAQKNLATLDKVLRLEAVRTIEHFLHRAGHEGCLKNLERRKPLYDTKRYHDPRDSRLVVDIRPDRECPGRKLASIYDPDGYLFAKIALKPFILQIEGHRTPSASRVDIIEKITLYKRIPRAVPEQERRATDHERTLRLKFARETKSRFGCFPGQSTSDEKAISAPSEDRLMITHIVKFKPPSVVLGQETQELENYALSQRLSSWSAFTADGKRTVQFAGDSVLVAKTDPRGRLLSQISERVINSAKPSFIP